MPLCVLYKKYHTTAMDNYQPYFKLPWFWSNFTQGPVWKTWGKLGCWGIEVWRFYTFLLWVVPGCFPERIAHIYQRSNGICYMIQPQGGLSSIVYNMLMITVKFTFVWTITNSTPLEEKQGKFLRWECFVGEVLPVVCYYAINQPQSYFSLNFIQF